MQLFVGVWPPPDVQEILAAYPRPALRGLRWSTPGQWLVNIRPLGHVSGALLAELAGTLGSELGGFPAMTATLGTPLHGDWLRAPAGGLEELTDAVFEVTEPIVPRTHPHKRWSAQLVLARGRSPRELVVPLDASWTVTSVSLAKSARVEGRPGYQDVAAFPLSG